MLRDILITILFLGIFNLLLLRFKKLQLKAFRPFVTLALFNIKFVVGLLIWFIYTFYYTDVQNNDVHKFYSDALVMRNAVNTSPAIFVKLLGSVNDSTTSLFTSQMKNWERNFDEAPFNENRTVIKLNALLTFISGKIYFVHTLFMCFISLVGWVLLTNAVFKNSATSVLPAALLILLLPSVLFWTSGVMKEPLLVLGLGLFVHGMATTHWKAIIYLLLGALIILMIKFFVLVCLVPAAIAYYILKNSGSTKTIAVKYATVYIVLLIAAFNMQYLVPRINLPQMLASKQTHSIKEAEYFKAGSKIEIPAVEPNAFSIIKTAPVGIWNTLFRPYMWEGKNIMMLASAAENVLVIILLIGCLWLTDYSKISQLNLVFFLLCFALTYFALIGICTPVLGNLVRYRAPLLPVFLFAFLLNVNFRPLPLLNTLLRSN